MRRAALSLAVLVVGACAGVAAAAGGASEPEDGPTATLRVVTPPLRTLTVPVYFTPPLAVTIAQTGGFAGPITYHLNCTPVGGSLPNPLRACRAIYQDPSMLRSIPAGGPISCPFGLSDLHITGVYADKPVDATFVACTSGQLETAGRWAALVPTNEQRLTVHVDRGIGLFRVGQSAASVRAALAPGQRACAICSRVYPVGYSSAVVGNHSFKPALIVVYAHGTLQVIASTIPDTTVRGVGVDNSYQAIRRRLPTWRVQTCPNNVRRLIHGAGPATVLTFGRYYNVISVQRAPPACT
jgi:hypothetical protein